MILTLTISIFFVSICFREVTARVGFSALSDMKRESPVRRARPHSMSVFPAPGAVRSWHAAGTWPDELARSKRGLPEFSIPHSRHFQAEAPLAAPALQDSWFDVSLIDGEFGRGKRSHQLFQRPRSSKDRYESAMFYEESWNPDSFRDGEYLRDKRAVKIKKLGSGSDVAGAATTLAPPSPDKGRKTTTPPPHKQPGHNDDAASAKSESSNMVDSSNGLSQLIDYMHHQPAGEQDEAVLKKMWEQLAQGRRSSNPVQVKDQEANESGRREYEENPMKKELVDRPKDLYYNAINPGVIVRVVLAEAILKMSHRNYFTDPDQSVVDGDQEYVRLIRKTLRDELDDFSMFMLLVRNFAERKKYTRVHSCDSIYYVQGVPWTNFSHSEENMKRFCLFDSVFLDRVAYTVGHDGSLMASVAPPLLQCDAATCTALPFVDAQMFEKKLQATHVRVITSCQAECRRRCRNAVACLEKCNLECDTPCDDSGAKPT